MSQFPSMPLYCADLITDTYHLSPEVFGVYVRILCAMWNADGTIPDDDRFLALTGGVSVRKWHVLRQEIDPFLTALEDGRLTQKKLLKIRRKLIEKSSKFKNNAAIRWDKVRQNRSKNNKPPHANAYADANAGHMHRARDYQIQNLNTEMKSTTSEPVLPRADALGAAPAGPTFEASDALLNTRIFKKGH